MSSTHGMNVEEVRRLASDLAALSGRVEQMAALLEQKVGSATWVGPDANRFKQQWWPQHRSHLRKVANDLQGFGDSARNNADEQERASGVRSGGASGGGPVGGPGAGSGNGSSPSAPTGSGPGGPSLGHHITPAEAKAIADRYIPAGERTNYDFNGAKDAQGDWYQCTVWAKARWRQLAEERGVKIPDWRGDGDAVAGNINRILGRPDSSTPTVGAIVSMNGHVAVVEEVKVENGVTRFRISEMNTGFVNGKRVNDWSVAIPDEFSDQRWLTAGSGYTFAAFPG